MTELFVDFSSPAALTKSHDVQAAEMRSQAGEADNERDRAMYLSLAEDAEELAAEIRREFGLT